MSAGSIDPVLALVNEVRFAFQPLINVKTGAIVAVEALTRPTGGNVHDLFREAARHRRLTELDVETLGHGLHLRAQRREGRGIRALRAVSYTHLTLPTNREV